MKTMMCRGWAVFISLLVGLTIAPLPYALAVKKIVYIEPGTSEAEKSRVTQWAKEVEQKFPEIDFEVNFIGWPTLNARLITMVMGGNPPDIVMHQDVLDLVRMGMFEPLDKWLEEKPISVSKEVLTKAALDYAKIEGKTYLVPTIANVWGLAFREDMLNEAGFGLGDLRNWDDLLAAAQAMTRDTNGDGKIDQYGFVYPSALARYAWRHVEIMAHSDGFYLDEVETNRKGYLEVLEFIRELQPSMPPGAVTMGLQEAYQAWGLNMGAMMVGANFQFGNVLTINKESLKHTRFLPFPLGPSGTNYRVPMTGMGYALFKASKNKEAAWKVINYFTCREKAIEQAAYLDYVPGRKDMSPEDIAKFAERYYSGIEEANTQWIKDVVAATSKYAIARKKTLGGTRIWREFTGIMNDFLRGKLTGEETYEQVKRKILDIKAEFE